MKSIWKNYYLWLLVVCGAACHCHCLAEASDNAKHDLPRVRISPSGQGFQTEDGKPVIFWGVNYFRPGTGWAPQLWKQFDAEATRRDFNRLKELGANCIRVFLSFGSFYEKPGELSADGLSKFDQLLEMAAESGLYVHPTGPDHWEGTPEWARGDRYAKEEVLRGLEEFWRLFAARYRGRTTIMAYDLLNEPAIPWSTPSLAAGWNEWIRRHYGTVEKAAQAWGVKPETISWEQMEVPKADETTPGQMLLDYQHYRESVADTWTRRQVKAIKAADPEALVTIGFIQWTVPVLLPGLQHYAAFRPERQAPLLDFLEIHFYPLENGFYDYTRTEDELRNLAYVESIVREVSRFGKPVILAEFGWYGGGRLTLNEGKYPSAEESAQARWCRRLVETTAPWASGWLNWGFYDHPQARDVTQLTGLLTVDGKLKAWGKTFERLAKRGLKMEKTLSPISDGPAVEWDRYLTNRQEAADFRQRYLQFFKNRPTSLNSTATQTPPDQILLKDYLPRSIFKIPETQVDKARYPAIDVHSHDYAPTDAEVDRWVRTMDETGIEKTIILAGSTGKRFDAVAAKYGRYPKRFEVWCGIDYAGMNQPGYGPAAVAELERCYKAGAKGVGELSDKGRGLGGTTNAPGMHIDDPRMDLILAKCAALRLPLNIHVGEDKWMYEPMDKSNDGLMNAWKWRIPDDPAVLRHDEVVNTLERAVKKHPQTLFVACHLANCCSDLNRLAMMFDLYPNLYADIGARFAELSPIPRFVSQFFMRYQDRIFYGTDMNPEAGMYRVTFRLLETADEHFYPVYFRKYHWPMHAWALPDGVLNKIYRENARRVLLKP